MKIGTIGSVNSLGLWLAAEVVRSSGERLVLRTWKTHSERCAGYPSKVAQMPKDRFIPLANGLQPKHVRGF